MIEKLDLDNGYATVDWLPTQHGKRCGAKEIQTTVNQLVDAVNELQLAKDVMFNRIDRLNDAMCDMRIRITALEDPTYHEEPEPSDPYAEQCRWIGKLCWYKLCEGDTWKVGRLEKIQENADAGYPFVFDGLCYKICEPVKPDSELIYHGE